MIVRFTRGAFVAVVEDSALARASHVQKAEVIHWEASGGEVAAINEVADAYTKSGGKHS